MPSRPEPSSVLIVFFSFFLLTISCLLFQFTVCHYTFIILSLRLLAAPGFPFNIFLLFKINSDDIRLITKYTLSTIIHNGHMVCWHGNIYHCSDLSIYFRIRLVNIFVLCCDSHSLSLFEFKYKAHPHLIVYQTDKSMLNQVRSY